MEMDHVQKDNRRALPKLLLVLLGAVLLGGVMGFVSGWMGRSSATELSAAAVDYAIRAVLPWLLPVVSLALLAAALRNYRKARAAFANWDGENEETAAVVETHLNWTLLWTSAALVLDCFLMAVSWYSVLPGGTLAAVAVFILILAAIVLLQQKAVDLTRRMNPEKQGSVYDPNFRKKWLASCDEAEQKRIGQAAYQAHKAVDLTCVLLWAALVILDMQFSFGPLPAFAVLAVWGVQNISYILACIRMERMQ